MNFKKSSQITSLATTSSCRHKKRSGAEGPSFASIGISMAFLARELWVLREGLLLLLFLCGDDDTSLL